MFTQINPGHTEAYRRPSVVDWGVVCLLTATVGPVVR